jgi:hypothetical protein|tara:strand:- start:157 stop:273 length:117 start_codon:yes stop_codon:yes gene_type:complete
VRLFRNTKGGDWADAIGNVAKKLEQNLATDKYYREERL